ncbi:MAG: DUF362 domain-containing protein [Candidatus Aminicenantes bacterium]|nr:DUF362 domain-containing protein [Candidatus Aminicenantes bacterium]
MSVKNEQKNDRTQTRRDFLKTVTGAVASALFLGIRCDEDSESEPTVYGPRIGIMNPYVTGNGNPLLVCVEGTDLEIMLKKGLEAIGGLPKLLTNNQDVLIKPNFNEVSRYPWISSVECIVAIINEVKKITAGAIKVGDMGYEFGPGNYGHLGLESAVNEAGGSCVPFSSAYPVRRNSWDSSKPDFNVYTEVYNAPVIINTPVLKRHFIAAMTCALKCNVGTISGPDATESRAYLHFESPNLFAELAEIAGLIKPELNIVDALTIVTKDGPSINQGGVPVDVNKIVICGDMVATDAYCARIMEENDDGFQASLIQETLATAESLGLGTSNLANVEIIEITA